jgi:uncharacterized membrane protein
MNDNYAGLPARMPDSWHMGGLFMGMHWAWWVFVAATLVVLIWAFWLGFAERGTTQHEEAKVKAAEEALRQRFRRGELSEEQLAENLRSLRESL